jgi:hypothetical protein
VNLRRGGGDISQREADNCENGEGTFHASARKCEEENGNSRTKEPALLFQLYKRTEN